MLDSGELFEVLKDNILAFLLGYALATGELHMLLADLAGLA